MVPGQGRGRGRGPRFRGRGRQGAGRQEGGGGARGQRYTQGRVKGGIQAGGKQKPKGGD